MANTLGPDSCVTLPMYHAFTGCDTLSYPKCRGKCTAWDRTAYDEVTPAFCALAAASETVDTWLCPLERLPIFLYDCTSSQEVVNGARKPFTQRYRGIVLRHKQYLSRKQSGLLTKPVTVGHRRSLLQSFYLQVNGGGSGMITMAGKCAGKLFLK